MKYDVNLDETQESSSKGKRKKLFSGAVRNRELVSIIEKIRTSNDPKQKLELYKEISKRFGVPYGWAEELVDYMDLDNPNFFNSGWMVIPYDEVERVEKITKGVANNPYILKIDEINAYSFPVSLAIHKYASKRSVIEYIEKYWDVIDGVMGLYRDEKKRAKKTKYDSEIYDIIYKYRSLPTEEIIEKLAKKGHKLMYDQVNKLKHEELKRRSK